MRIRFSSARACVVRLNELHNPTSQSLPQLARFNSGEKNTDSGLHLLSVEVRPRLGAPPTNQVRPDQNEILRD